MRERVITIGLIATALLAVSSQLMQALQYNLTSVAVTSTCMGNARSSQPLGSAWFEMWSASCAGEVELAWEAKSELIVLNSDRLEAVRATARYDEVLAQLAVTTHPDSPEAQVWLGDALREKNDRAGAIEAYRQGLALESTNADAWMTLGRLYEEQGDLQKAVEAYDQACVFVDGGKNGCPSAGRIYLATGMYDLAAARYTMSLQQIGEGWLPGREGLVKALLAAGRTQEAIPHLTVLAANGSAGARETLAQLGASK